MDADEALAYAEAMNINGRNRRPIDRVVESLAAEVRRLRKALREAESKIPTHASEVQP